LFKTNSIILLLIFTSTKLKLIEMLNRFKKSLDICHSKNTDVDNTIDNNIDEIDLIDTRVLIDRYAFNKKKFDEYNPNSEFPAFNTKTFIKKKFEDTKCDKSLLKKQLYNRVPSIQWLRNYDFRGFFLSDIIAGITVGIMHIPYGKFAFTRYSVGTEMFSYVILRDFA
jgi:hypothetical protein